MLSDLRSHFIELIRQTNEDLITCYSFINFSYKLVSKDKASRAVDWLSLDFFAAQIFNFKGD
jgi:hypothetical protein